MYVKLDYFHRYYNGICITEAVANLNKLFCLFVALNGNFVVYLLITFSLHKNKGTKNTQTQATMYIFYN